MIWLRYSLQSQFEIVNDGDKALCVQDETLVKVAERNMEGIVPLYYEMAKAPAEEVNSEDIYKSLVLAYKANIGEISNNITKIWNSNDVNLDVIKWLCMENNFIIDYAKTLYMPTRPESVNKEIAKYIKSKVPHFFIYAKDKELKNVEELNDSTVNKLETIISDKRINFQKVVSKFDFKMFMVNENIMVDNEIIESYTRFDRNKKWLMIKHNEIKNQDKLYIYKFIRDELLKINNNKEYVTDVLIKYLYNLKESKNKTTLWESFGDVIIKNLKSNLNIAEECSDCGCRYKQTKQRQIRCENCQMEMNKINARLRKRKQRKLI